MISLQKKKAALLDLNGVFFEDQRLLPGAAEAIPELRRSGLHLRFVTNTSTHSSADLHDRLTDMGLAIHPEEILSPISTARILLEQKGNPSVHLILRENAKAEFQKFPSSHTKPDYIVLGDIEDRWNYSILNTCFEMVMYGAQMIALHKNRYQKHKGEIQMDIGGFVAALEYATDHEAIVIGKPSAAFFQTAMESLGMTPEEIFMVGDDIHADVKGAQDAGIDAVLVKTGKYRSNMVHDTKIMPEAIIDSIADLPSMIG